MSGFLDHLAGMAIGARLPGEARVALTPRFAPQPSAPEDRLDDGNAIDTAASPAMLVPQLNSVPGHARESAPTAGALVTARSPERGVSHPPSPHRVAPTIGEAPEGVDRPMRAAPLASIPAAPVRAQAAATVAAPARNPLPAQPIAYSASRDEPERSSREPEPPRAAPLAESLLAGRVARHNDAPPVIHVTIDRIDIRAPVPVPQVTRPARPRAAPAVSLADYLRDKAGSGRP